MGHSTLEAVPGRSAVVLTVTKDGHDPAMLRAHDELVVLARDKGWRDAKAGDVMLATRRVLNHDTFDVSDPAWIADNVAEIMTRGDARVARALARRQIEHVVLVRFLR